MFAWFSNVFNWETSSLRYVNDSPSLRITERISFKLDKSTNDDFWLNSSVVSDWL
jgi:hypothetical protein